MIKKAHTLLSSHYGYFLGLSLVSMLAFVLINLILGFLNFSTINLSVLREIINHPSPENATATFNTLLSFILENSITFLIFFILQWIFNNAIIILFLRSIYQKIAFPDTSLSKAAFFNTPFSKIVTLPLKQFIANLLLFITYGIIIFVITPTMTNSDYPAIFALLSFILFFILGIAAIPINNIIPYDVEERYKGFEVTFKGLSIAFGQFFQFLKMFLVVFLIMILYSILMMGIARFLPQEYVSLILPILFFFWIYPLSMLYMTLCINSIFKQTIGDFPNIS